MYIKLDFGKNIGKQNKQQRQRMFYRQVYEMGWNLGGIHRDSDTVVHVCISKVVFTKAGENQEFNFCLTVFVYVMIMPHCLHTQPGKNLL